MSAITFTETLNTLHCPNCFITFAIPVRFEEERRWDKQTFYCPMGHHMSYTGTEKSNLEKELKTAREQRDAAIRREQLERDQKQAAEAERDRIKKRTLKNGVCPCCRRSFASLARHMKHKHPEYLKK